MKRKIISLLLCLVMALSLIPTVAFGATADTVDHIDVLLALNINGKKEYLNSDDLNAITITSSTSNYSVTRKTLNGSTDAQGQSQARFTGTFPVGTKEAPVTYTLSLTKVVDGVSYDLTLTTNYWDENNFCPPTLKDQKNPLSGHKDTWKNGGVVKGSGIDVEFGTANASTKQVIITKNIYGVDSADLVGGKAFTFTIYEEDGVTPVGSPLTATTTTENPSSANAMTYLVPGTYVVKETTSASYDNYTLSGTTYGGGAAASGTLVVGDNGGLLTVTNTYEKNAPATTSVTVTKVWNDDNNSFNTRPESVTVELLADGTKEEEEVLTSTDKWTATFDNLPEKDKEGNLINYTVQEKPVPGYTSQVIEPGNPVVTVGALTKVPNCNFTTFNTEGANLVIAKLTENEGYVVWTETQLTDDQQATLRKQVKAACNIPDNKTVNFISGKIVTHTSEKGTATFTSEKLTFGEEKVWSMFWYGNVTESQANNGFTIINTLNKGNDVNKYATLTITKVGENNKLLPGAVFKLVNGDTTLTSKDNENGTYTISGINAEGDWTLTETKAPEGYQKTSQSWTIKVDANASEDLTDGEYVTTTPYMISAVGENELTSAVQEYAMEIENIKIPDTVVPITITKTVTISKGSKEPVATPFTFEAYVGNQKVGELKLTPKSADKWTATDNLTVSIPYNLFDNGVATVTIKEIPGGDTRWKYDTKEYKVLVYENGTYTVNPQIAARATADQAQEPTALTFTNEYSNKYTPTPKPTTPAKPVTSVKTGDMGVALYAGLAILSMTGSAGVILRRRKNDK